MPRGTKTSATPPKKTATSGGKFGDVWNGEFKDSPAYKKVMSDKAKQDANLDAYRKKVAAQKAAAIQTAKKK